jgi:hypothetical protein
VGGGLVGPALFDGPLLAVGPAVVVLVTEGEAALGEGVPAEHPAAVRAVAKENATTVIHRDVFRIWRLSPLRARADITPSRRRMLFW